VAADRKKITLYIVKTMIALEKNVYLPEE
jgi:hypothetical protein